jgi:hypothetical protein
MAVAFEPVVGEGFWVGHGGEMIPDAYFSCLQILAEIRE